MIGDSKIVVPNRYKSKFQSIPAGTYVNSLPISPDVKLKEMTDRLAQIEELISKIQSSGSTIKRLIVSFDGSVPSIVSDSYNDSSVTMDDSSHIRIISPNKWVSTPFVLSTNLNVGWIKEDSSNIVFELPEDYSGNPFIIKIWEESV